MDHSVYPAVSRQPPHGTLRDSERLLHAPAARTKRIRRTPARARTTPESPQAHSRHEVPATTRSVRARAVLSTAPRHLRLFQLMPLDLSAGVVSALSVGNAAGCLRLRSRYQATAAPFAGDASFKTSSW